MMSFYSETTVSQDSGREKQALKAPPSSYSVMKRGQALDKQGVEVYCTHLSMKDVAHGRQ